ncbi:MAG: helix-turn-helix domain-containing protein [Planctomycetota bacterium]|jgi:hypothetical protein
MSIRVMSIVWEYSQHKGNALLVLLAIADFADDFGAAWPSIEKLRTKARISERQTIRIIKKLEDSGELLVKHRRHVGNYYMIALDVLTDKMTDKESVIEPEKESVILTDTPESQILTDTAESVKTDSIESDDPPLTVIKPPVKERAIAVDATREAVAGEEKSEESLDIAGEDNVYEWLEEKKQSEVESGVRPPAEALERVQHTADTIKNRVRAAVIDNAKRNQDLERNPVIETFLGTVPEHVRELARVFCYHKGRPPLKTEDALWRREWQDQFDINVNAENVTKAVEYMRRHNLAVRSPASTLTIAENIRQGHIKLEEDRQIKSSEVSYDLPLDRQVEVADEEEVSPMEHLLRDDGQETEETI